MRRLVACSVAITLLAGLPATRSIATSETVFRLVSDTSNHQSTIDYLVFEVPLERFRAERSRMKRRHGWLITVTDGCSAPILGSTGRSFNFRAACERHDLAYANYQLLARLGFGVAWDAVFRARVDDRFQSDLQQSCTKRRHSERLRCDAWAIVYFHAVRIAAGP